MLIWFVLLGERSSRTSYKVFFTLALPHSHPNSLDPDTALSSQRQLVKVTGLLLHLPLGAVDLAQGRDWPVRTVSPEALWSVFAT